MNRIQKFIGLIAAVLPKHKACKPLTPDIIAFGPDRLLVLVGNEGRAVEQVRRASFAVPIADEALLMDVVGVQFGEGGAIAARAAGHLVNAVMAIRHAQVLRHDFVLTHMPERYVNVRELPQILPRHIGKRRIAHVAYFQIVVPHCLSAPFPFLYSMDKAGHDLQSFFDVADSVT